MLNQSIDRVLLDAFATIKPKSEKEKHLLISNRNKDISIHYFGINGSINASMQETGEIFGGLTRESVRQIIKSISNELSVIIKDKSNIIDAINSIYQSTPITSFDAKEMLVNKMFIDEKSLITPEAIINVGKALALKTKYPQKVRHGDMNIILSPRNKNLAKEIESIAISQISHNGAVTLSKINDLSPGRDGPRKRKFVKAIINNMKDIVCANQELELFYFKTRGRNRLLKRIEMIFDLFEEVSIENLQIGISRNWTKNKTIISSPLSIDEIASVLLSTNRFSIQNGVVKQITANKNTRRPRNLEINMVKMIHECENGICNEKRLEDKFVENKRDKWSFSITLNYCPFILRNMNHKGDHIRGEYILIGKLKSA